MNTKHPLIGKWLIRVEEDEHVLLLYKFTADLGNGLMLVARHCPEHGNDSGVFQVLNLQGLSTETLYQILATKEEAMAFLAADDEVVEMPQGVTVN